MRSTAIDRAIKATHPGVESFSNGNMVVGQDFDHVAIAFNNTEHCQNQITVLNVRDAQDLFRCLHAAGLKNGWIV